MSCAVQLLQLEELTVEALAELESLSVRRARAVVQHWFSLQLSGEPVPFVERRVGPDGGHPRYYVEATSYEAWSTARELSAGEAIAAAPQARRRKVGVRGCSCVRMVLENGAAGAFVSADCAVHGSLL